MLDAARERPAHAPADHPALPRPKIGVLLANLGTPDHYSYWPMRRYLNEFLSDRRVIDLPRWFWQPLLQLVILTKRPFTSGRNYKLIWNEEAGESPLMTITKAQTAALRSALTARFGDQVEVDFAMRYGNPSTAGRLKALTEKGCDKVLFVPLYPQYAGATTGTANDAFFRAAMALWRPPAVRTLAEYFAHPAYIAALAASVKAAYAGLQTPPQKLVVSYHGMPQRYLRQGDPYHCQCAKTTRLLREALGWAPEAIDSSFQSVFGREEWLRPYTVQHVAALAKQGIRRIAVVAPAFAADCIETLEEINGEIRHAFMEAGGEEFTYIPCLNDSPGHIAALAEIISENLGGWAQPKAKK